MKKDEKSKFKLLTNTKKELEIPSRLELGIFKFG